MSPVIGLLLVLLWGACGLAVALTWVWVVWTVLQLQQVTGDLHARLQALEHPEGRRNALIPPPPWWRDRLH